MDTFACEFNFCPDCVHLYLVCVIQMHKVKPPHQSRRDGPPAGHSGARIRKNNVWTASVQEETIINDFENIDGLQKYSRERGVESYDFTLNRDR